MCTCNSVWGCTRIGCTWLEFCVIGCMWLWFGCMCDWTLGSRVVEDEVYMTSCEGVYMSVF